MSDESRTAIAVGAIATVVGTGVLCLFDGQSLSAAFAFALAGFLIARWPTVDA